MYKIEWKNELPLIVIMSLVTAVVMISYPYLPGILPMHWNAAGEVDGTAAKSPLSAFFHLGIIWACFFGMLYLPYIDPKRDKYGKFLDAYRIIRYAIIILLCAISVIVTATALGYKIPMEKAMPVIVAIEFIVIGNYMGKIRTNWFVGIKLPWTLENEEVWNKTHRLTGRLFVICGIIGIAAIALPGMWTFIIFMGSLFGVVVISTVYSYLVYRKIKDGPKNSK
jgi:uncharacterized membrane protein